MYGMIEGREKDRGQCGQSLLRVYHTKTAVEVVSSAIVLGQVCIVLNRDISEKEGYIYC